MRRSSARFLTITLILSLLMSILCIIAVVNSSTRIIYFGIRQNISMLSLRSQLNALLLKLICAMAMLISGVFCIYLYLQTYESQHFLQMSIIFFLASGVIMSLLDYQALFYATNADRRLCNFCADIFLILFSCFILADKISLPSSRVTGILKLLLFAAHFSLIFSRFYITTPGFQPLFRGYAYCVLGGTILLFLVQAFILPSRQALQTFFALVPLNVLLLSTAHFRFNSLSDHYETFQQMTPYFLVLYCELLFNSRYQVHRMAVLLGRVGKRRLQEDEQYRQTLMRTLLMYCRKPINGLSRISQNLEESSNMDPSQTAASIRREVLTLNRSINDAIQHVRIHGATLDLDINRFSPQIVFAYVRNEIKIIQEDLAPISVSIPSCPDLQGDPTLLIRANRTLLLSLMDEALPARLSISLEPLESHAMVCLQAQYSSITARQMHRLMRKLRRVSPVNQTIPDDDLFLTIAKAILAAHGTELTVQKIGSGGIRLSYQLPVWERAPSEKDSSPADDASGADNVHAVRVAMLSTSERQREFVRQCLSRSVFQLDEFSEASLLTAHLEREHVNVVIIGTLYAQTDPLDICRTIRRKYAIGLMPIILLRQNGLDPIESFYYEYINDFIFEPCSYEELNQRILSLSMLQRSTESLRLARLEFLQSQMDPHFIFNAISAIMPLCLEKPQQAYTLLGSFSDYLRGNLFPKEHNHPIHIYEEVDLIRAYLSLEDARTPDRIQYDVIEDYNPDCVIYPLLIEPLAENCVKHGLRQGKSELLHIEVSIRQQNGKICVSVRDDGIGFDPQSPSSRPSSGKIYRSIGLDNLRKRLQLYYHAALQVESQPGKGTNVSFEIPVSFQKD